jgi:acyl dehydratase
MTDRLLPAGLYRFADLQAGDRIETDRIVVSEALIDRFADLTGDRFAIHMSDEAAQELGFPRRVAHGLLVLSLVDGLKNQAPAELAAIASLGWEWRFRKPVLAGDEIRATLTVVSKRLTSDPWRGIVALDVDVRDGEGELVQSGQNQLMMIVQANSAPASAGEWRENR